MSCPYGLNWRLKTNPFLHDPLPPTAMRAMVAGTNCHCVFFFFLIVCLGFFTALKYSVVFSVRIVLISVSRECPRGCTDKITGFDAMWRIWSSRIYSTSRVLQFLKYLLIPFSLFMWVYFIGAPKTMIIVKADFCYGFCIM